MRTVSCILALSNTRLGGRFVPGSGNRRSHGIRSASLSDHPTIALLFALLVLLSGCGGGGDDASSGGRITGIAQKGPFLPGGSVTAYPVTATGERGTGATSATIGGDGAYQLATSWIGVTEIVVMGRFYDEIAAAESSYALQLSALVNLAEDDAANVNVNLFTHLAAARIRGLMAGGHAFTEARTRAEADLRRTFGLALEPAGPEHLNLLDGSGPDAPDNANLLLLSSALLVAGLDQARIDAMAGDWGDDGSLNAAGMGDFARLRLAARRVALDEVAAHIGSVYPAAGEAPGLADLGHHNPGWVLSGQLNDTGFTACGDHVAPDGNANHNNDIDCSQVAAAGSSTGTDGDGNPVPAGQDAHFGRDVLFNDDSDGHAGFSYTKLGADGRPLPDQGADYAGTAWDCVRDNATGLTWEVKTADGGLRDRGHTYSWYDSAPGRSGGEAGRLDGGTCSGSACDTASYVAAVNAAGLCGHGDWRLPDIGELSSLLDRSVAYPAPTLDAGFFPNTASGEMWPHSAYWSSSPDADYSQYAWGAYFRLGYIDYDNKLNAFHVRLVRD